MADDFEVFIEEDGTISVKIDKVISPMQHRSADSFLKMVKELAGGTVVEKKLPHGHSHQHGKVKAGQ